ncbi:hypothetical protein [Actinoplanes couchii]|uniref:MFS transporter n=1 Tax=Actinoplanes couchii TaxID=403638 RepID=A0ABQ3XT60_9ACTN|nr:hypothetical protein [Actinoplanes couchii]MDR6324094.1 hypothetical protein [Actinoplanes couchii]GID61620.1 hypothetical protein Aco03nite_100240 [Actinoplanes couchii]
MTASEPTSVSRPRTTPKTPRDDAPRRDVRRAWAAYAVSQAGSGIGAGALPLVAILLLDASDWQV